MKRHLVGLLPLVCIAPTAIAEAQYSEESNYQNESESDDNVPETYMVQPGDTLWDISANILQNPWYWPKIWSYNPDITNPHMIYPGDYIRFSQANGERPMLADPVSRQMAMGTGEGNDDQQVGEDEEQPVAKQRPLFEIISDQATSHRAPGTVQVMVESLLSKEELSHTGVIYKAAEDKILLSVNDKIYLKFPEGQDVSIGERFLIFRTLEQVKHPKTKEKLGFLTQITGEAEVIMTSEKVATAIIRKGNQIIERGQFVMPLSQDIFRLVEPKENESEVEAYIVANKFQETDLIGEQEIVFIDKGSKDGVAIGNTFGVMYQGDPLFGVDEDLPEEEIGRLMVVDVKENFSTAIVMKAIREIELGTKVRMKP